MLQRSTIEFLKKLKKNNNRDWFNQNKELYNKAKEDFISFIQTLIDQIAAFDKSLNGVEARNCIFRIYRDVRFSKDKTPYKPNFGANMAQGGRKSMSSGYYIHLEPGSSFLAGGVYMPPTPQLNAIRQEIDYNIDEFKTIINNKEFKKYFEGLSDMHKLKMAPKGYPKDHPEIELLKFKSYIVTHNLEKEMISEHFLKYCSKVFNAMTPLNEFLNRCLD